MSVHQFDLFRQRRFTPLFAAQVLGVFNDNYFKNALAILILFRLLTGTDLDGQAEVLVSVAAAIFTLPYVLFSSIAGQIADKYDRTWLVRVYKTSEIAVCAVAIAGIYHGSLTVLLFALFLFGLQSALFSPVRYALVPVHLDEDELVSGNGLFEGGIFVAILVGTIVANATILLGAGYEIAAGLMLVAAGVGWAAAKAVPPAPASAPWLKLSWNLPLESYRMLRYAADKPVVMNAILGIGYFYFVGAIFLVQLPSYTQVVLHGNQHVISLLLTMFTVGIAIGSVMAGRLLQGEVSARLVPYASLIITIAIVGFYLASIAAGPVLAQAALTAPLDADGKRLIGISGFMAVDASWYLTASLMLLALAGGLFIVPLISIMQARTEDTHRSRTIAGSNLVIALATLASSAICAGLLGIGVELDQLFLYAAALSAAVTAALFWTMPQDVARTAWRTLARLLFRIEVHGLEHLEASGRRAILVPNHMSYLDGPLLAAFLPETVTFAINTHIAQVWWTRPWVRLIPHLMLDPSNPMAIKALIKLIADGNRCVVFPEGRITETGALMKIYDGAALAADKADADIVPIRIEGPQFTPFGAMAGKLRLSWFPKMKITIMPVERLDLPKELIGRDRRARAGTRLYDIMTDAAFRAADTDITLFDAFSQARRTHGSGRVILDDAEWSRVPYRRMAAGAHVLGAKIAKRTEPKEVAGILLPNAAGAAVVFFAFQAAGRVPAMLNFSAGPKTVVDACKAACIRHVFTSRRFVEAGRLHPLIEAIGSVAQVHYLEDIRAEVSLADRLGGLASTYLPHSWVRPRGVAPDDPAVVLFTSGSEGPPKGVVLSHRNIVSNCKQIGARVDFNPSDLVFNALPMFHSFGLTGGTLLPILSGVRVFLYPSPLHYRMVPELVYLSNATIMFGTDTFLSAYAKRAHPYDFYRMRYIFAGAERVRPETRATFANRYGVRLLEGYGATETSPVLAVNAPMAARDGSVGRLLPAMEHRLESVPGVDAGGRLVVRGPNVMLGYLRTTAPGVVEPPADGWYDTGDIVDIDGDGFVKIVGRTKRFAKVAGEMVALAEAETLAQAIWPEDDHAVVAVPDDRKGEKLVLVTTRPDADWRRIADLAQERQLSPLVAPRIVHVVSALPVLGTGKTDYFGLQTDIAALMAAGPAGSDEDDEGQRPVMATKRTANLA